ncbi:MAG: hypothetical protein MHM6MM_006486 [Cercozoa sp. M6MM]
MDNDAIAVYEWVDSAPLSRRKRKIERDFSDGVLAAELLRHFGGGHLVQLHNYTPSNSVTAKKYNWQTLNRKVLSRIGASLDDDTLTALASAKPGVIEQVLLQIRCALEKWRTEGKHKQHHSRRRVQRHSATQVYKEPAHNVAATQSYASSSDTTTTTHKYDSTESSDHSVIPLAPSNPRSQQAAPSIHNTAETTTPEDPESYRFRRENNLLKLKLRKMEEILDLKDEQVRKLRKENDELRAQCEQLKERQLRSNSALSRSTTAASDTGKHSLDSGAATGLHTPHASLSQFQQSFYKPHTRTRASAIGERSLPAVPISESHPSRPVSMTVPGVRGFNAVSAATKTYDPLTRFRD